MSTDESVSFPAATWRQSLAFGLFLILLAGLILWSAQSIRVNDFGNSDPGPRAIPVACAVLMLIGGVYELLVGLWQRRLHPTAPPAFEQNASKSPAGSGLSGTQRGIITLLGLVVYLVAMNWLGFNLSTVIFSTLALIALGSRWWTALLSSVAIALLIHLLFVNLFQVSLPLSVWGNF